MSSIAYVTDQEMIEYHRLCGNRNVNFWRLSARAGFSAFRRGDLLFFYAYGPNRRKKGLVGYAHFEKTMRLSLKEMWKRFGTANGYENISRLEEAIRVASRNGEVPKRMNCLYLTDCVYFASPVWPRDVGLRINEKLESYTYIDKDDPRATIRILDKASEYGLNIWSESQSSWAEDILRKDRIRRRLALVHGGIGKDLRTDSELRRAKKLVQPLLEKGYELIQGSGTDCFKDEGDGIHIAMPFVCNAHDRKTLTRDWLGRMVIYRMSEEGPGEDPLVFEVVGEEQEPQTAFLRRAAEHGGI